MKSYRVLILIGLLVYVISFFLIAVRGTGLSLEGYKCALVTLLTPWGSDGVRMLRESPLDFFSTLFSGWINPVFLITTVILLIRPNSGLGAILRVVVLLMFPACWLVFYKEHFRPGEAYFLWTAAMVLVLFSNKLIRTPSTRAA